jgi:hypothetical protein
MLAMLVVGAVAGLSTTADAQRSRYPQNQPTITQEAYNRCLQLALARGENLGVGNMHQVELFVAACLRGKIPF